MAQRGVLLVFGGDDETPVAGIRFNYVPFLTNGYIGQGEIHLQPLVN